MTWWQEAREKVVGLSPSNRGEIFCQDWARTMYSVLESYFQNLPEADLHLMYSLNNDHWWIEAEYDGQKWLYDGTAGQETTQEDEYQLGLYGKKSHLFKKLSPSIVSLYKLGREIEVKSF